MEFMSIGESCQVAYQIRRYTGEGTRYLFDWVISDVNCVVKCITNFQRDLFLTNDSVEVVDQGRKVRDNYTGIMFQHDFPVNCNHIVTDELAHDNLNSVREKYLYLLEKTNRLLEESTSEPLVFVFYDWRKNGLDFCTDVLEKLKSCKSSINREMFFMICSSAISEDVFHSNAAILKIDEYDGDEKKFFWRGNDQSWDSALERFTEKYKDINIE